jgi:hypothetical protein
VEDVIAMYEQSLAIDPQQPEVTAALARLTTPATRSLLDDTKAPEIKLISPNVTRSFTIESDNSVIDIVGKAIDSSGIDRVVINGRQVQRIESDGLFVAEVELKSGADNLVIEATDKKNNKAVAKYTIDVTGKDGVKAPSPPPDAAAIVKSEPKYYAVLIAENDYIDNAIPDLQKPVQDALELRKILLEKYTFEPENIDTVFNSSREAIMMAIARRANAMTDHDNLLIFYAGHGIAVKDRFGNNDGFWIPSAARKGQEFTYVSQGDINSVIKRSNAKHILLIADACFSGSFIRMETRDINTEATKDIVRQFEVPSRKVMASGSLEPVPDESVFLRYLSNKLKENKDKYVAADDLFMRIKPAIINNSTTLPQFASIINTGDEGGQFILIKRQ